MAKKKEKEVQIRMETAIAGHNWSARPGQVIARPESEAKRLIASGQATPVKASGEDKAAADLEAENTALKERVAELEAASAAGADETAATRTGSGSGKAG